jgi:hypothetical protein
MACAWSWSRTRRGSSYRSCTRSAAAAARTASTRSAWAGHLASVVRTHTGAGAAPSRTRVAAMAARLERLRAPPPRLSCAEDALLVVGADGADQLRAGRSQDFNIIRG